MKKRIREIANELIKIAARAPDARGADARAVERDPYDEFAPRFPYEETEDQQAASIDAVLAELAPADRWTV